MAISHQSPFRAVLSRKMTPGCPDSEAILKGIVNGCGSYVGAFDKSGVLMCVSESWRAFALKNGFTSTSDAYGLYDLQTCREAVNGSGAKQVGLRESIHRIIAKQQVEFQEEFTFKSLSIPRWFLTRATKVEMPVGLSILVTLEDITRCKNAEDELRNIGGRLINAQEEERTRLARELHDDVSQRLAMLSSEIDRMRPQLVSDQSALKSAVDRLSKTTKELCADVHRLSYQLHPFTLDYLGLSASIESLCAELSARQDLEIKFRQLGFPSTIPEDVTLCVFRIAQESLHNVVRHSDASKAEVLLIKTADAVHLRVSDNGNGFDIEQARAKKRLGLISMKERLRLVHGRLSLSSQANQGTQVDVFIPLMTQGKAGRLSQSSQGNPRPRKLSLRQKEVLQLLAEGRPMKEVAFMLNVSPRTVAYHKYTIMNQLHLKNSAELIRFAVMESIVQ